MANIDLCSNCPAFQPKLECITVPKIFDQCRLQICLTPNEIGSAKKDCNPVICNNKNSYSSTNGRNSCSEETLTPPANAVSVTVDDFCIKSMNVLSKTKSAFRRGFFDINIRFIFGYILKFFNSDNMEISRVPACSSFTTTVSLFGGDDICVASFNELYKNITNSGPFVSIEASAMNLAAELRFPCSCCFNCGCGNNNSCGCNCGCGNNNSCGCNYGCSSCVSCDQNNCGCGNVCQSSPSPSAVDITIGLFAVIKLLRLSNMSVNSYGNCMPCECSEVSEATNPCDFFDNLPFPTDLFAPQVNYRPCPDVSGNTPTNGDCCCENRR